jgi:hypothetical protein
VAHPFSLHASMGYQRKKVIYVSNILEVKFVTQTENERRLPLFAHSPRERDCPKSPGLACGVAQRTAEKLLFVAFCPLHIDQIHAWSVARTPFRTVSEGVFSETQGSEGIKRAGAVRETPAVHTTVRGAVVFLPHTSERLPRTFRYPLLRKVAEKTHHSPVCPPLQRTSPPRPAPSG